ncbi:MAG TPA: phosphate ABC transporter permease, partial [Deltaproteobacteria bacterium]|nr:phosphate ABC transporter permease [Deltaproteobacteria bacterium]
MNPIRRIMAESEDRRRIEKDSSANQLLLSRRARRLHRAGALLGQVFLTGITSLSIIAVFFIFYFIAKDAIPFFSQQGFREFFTSTRWYPSASQPEFGVLAIFVGSGLVTLGAVLVSVPLGISAAVCLSDVLSFRVRQLIKPVIEVLAAIPSVAYGFFALVVFAPTLQNNGNLLLSFAAWMILTPVLLIVTVILADLLKDRFFEHGGIAVKVFLLLLLGAGSAAFMLSVQRFIGGLSIDSGTNALNVSI